MAPSYLTSSSSSSSSTSPPLIRRWLKRAPVLLALFQQAAQGFTVEVPSGQQQCFTVVSSVGEEVYGNFEVLTEGTVAPVTVRVSTRSSSNSANVFRRADDTKEVFSSWCVGHELILTINYAGD